MKNTKKRCPKCGGQEFNVNAHIIQRWSVDEDGNFLDINCDTVAVAHYPDDGDLWKCAKCGHSDIGCAFNVD